MSIIGYHSVDSELEWDNRDISTTELHDHKKKITFTVYPWDLVENCIENCVEDDKYCDLLIQELNTIKDKIDVYQDSVMVGHDDYDFEGEYEKQRKEIGGDRGTNNKK